MPLFNVDLLVPNSYFLVVENLGCSSVSISNLSSATHVETLNDFLAPSVGQYQRLGKFED